MGIKQKKKFFEKKIQSGRLKKIEFFKITNPWNFHKQFWELVILKNSIFLSRPLWIFFSKNFFFCLIPMKISHKLCDRMDGTQFWCFPLFPAPKLTPEFEQFQWHYFLPFYHKIIDHWGPPPHFLRVMFGLVLVCKGCLFCLFTLIYIDKPL
jgi:hypothetical protein